jgi:hypothetical protein
MSESKIGKCTFQPGDLVVCTVSGVVGMFFDTRLNTLIDLKKGTILQVLDAAPSTWPSMFHARELGELELLSLSHTSDTKLNVPSADFRPLLRVHMDGWELFNA